MNLTFVFYVLSVTFISSFHFKCNGFLFLFAFKLSKISHNRNRGEDVHSILGYGWTKILLFEMSDVLGSEVCMAMTTKHAWPLTLAVWPWPLQYFHILPVVKVLVFDRHRIKLILSVTELSWRCVVHYLFLLYTPRFTGAVPLKYKKNQFNILTSTYQEHNMMVLLITLLEFVHGTMYLSGVGLTCAVQPWLQVCWQVESGPTW